MMNNVIFLDRDGVINKKPPSGDYVRSWKEFELLPGAIEGLMFLTKHNYDIFIITNQPGIGRGMMTKDAVETIHMKFLDRCKKEGIVIKKIYYCPHSWEENCNCRKPKPGMLLTAAEENSLDLTKVLFIGDDERDKQAGDAAGCKTIVMPADGNLFEIVTKWLQKEK